MRNRDAKAMAMCGIMAALAVTVGALAGMIPIATYVIPVLQCVILLLVTMACPKRLCWSWYVSVAILNFLLCPDKEAAGMFFFLGYYPLVKPWFDGLPLALAAKLGFFIASTSAMYAMMIFLLGMDQLSAEFAELGVVLGIVCAALGCVTFVMLDVILTRLKRKFS